MKVILDTNFLVYLAENKIFDELDSKGYQLLMPRLVDVELEKIQCSDAKGSDKEAALLAQTIMKRWTQLKKAKYLDIDGDNADNAIFEYAKSKKGKVAVATLDAELKERLKKEQIPVIIIRQKKYIERE